MKLKLSESVVITLKNESLDDVNGISQCEKASALISELLETKFEDCPLCIIQNYEYIYCFYSFRSLAYCKRTGFCL